MSFKTIGLGGAAPIIIDFSSAVKEQEMDGKIHSEAVLHTINCMAERLDNLAEDMQHRHADWPERLITRAEQIRYNADIYGKALGIIALNEDEREKGVYRDGLNHEAKLEDTLAQAHDFAKQLIEGLSVRYLDNPNSEFREP